MRPVDSKKDLRHFPAEAIDRVTLPLAKFLRIEAASGILLALAAAVALVLANSNFAAGWQAFWDQKLTIGTDAFELSYPLWYWVNDALMAIFFFLVGLEIKRELVSGHLADRSQLLLPVLAALGGVLVPAGLFMALQMGTPGERGWAVPMATDIAFVVGALAVLGKRVPGSLKILLLSLAIVDDLLAVGVIAIFFSKGISIAWLSSAGVGLALVVILRFVGVRRVPIYVLVGIGVWLCTLKSGLHPTIAGVLLGFLTPARPWLTKESMQALISDAGETLQESIDTGRKPNATLDRLAFGAKESISPLERLEHHLHPWVGFLIMPIFALANSGVPFSVDAVQNPLAVAIAVALFVGKPIGICLAALVAVKLMGVKLPSGVNWPAMIGAGILCGTGFTMSLFIASLSFDAEMVVAARMGVLLGSGASLVVGMLVLRGSLPAKVVSE